MRAAFGASSRGWGLKLTEAQRLSWVAAAQTVPSHPSLGQYSHLSGQQLCVKINSTLRCIGQGPVDEPPAPVVFGPNPVTQLDIVNDPEAGVRLLLSVGTVTEDIMVFGQPPCSAGRMKHRRVYYLGLLGPVTNGQADIADLYTAKFGPLTPGKKVFIVTCQTKNGWKAQESVFGAIVPPAPPSGKQQVPAKSEVTQPAQAETPISQTAPDKHSYSVFPVVYKGSTPDAPREHKLLKREQPVSIPWAPLVHGVQEALARLARIFHSRFETATDRQGRARTPLRAGAAQRRAAECAPYHKYEVYGLAALQMPGAALDPQ